MHRYCVVLLLATLAGAIAHAGEAPRREIYAHYMGCFPAGSMATARHYREQAQDVDPNSTASVTAMQGGRFSNWPLVPQDWVYGRDDMRRAVEMEIRRAMRIGLDGFAVDAWAGGDGAKQVFETMLDVCKEKQLRFSVTVCLDPACLPAKTERYDDSAGGRIGAMHDTVRYLLGKFKDHPNLARRDGKPLIFTYQTRSFLTPEARTLGGGKNEPARWRNFLLALDGLRRMARQEFGTELFVHMDLENAFGGIDLKEIKGARLPHQPGPILADLAGYLAAGEGELRGYDAIGGFTGGNWEQEYESVAAKVRAAGCEWASPMMHQYNNKTYSINVEPGTNKLRRTWDKIRATDSTLIQYATWNDYGEDTSLSPGTETRYTVFDLTAYEIAWWKNGAPPKVERDKLYLTYRRYPLDARIYPFNARRYAEGVVEVATLLTAPATIRVPGRAESYEAPAGLFVRQFPLKPGPVAAEVVRDGKAVLKVVSPDPITDKPWREANEMVCYSSEFERQWEMDFPGKPPETYAENGDADGDGLPNWFEMLWFGKVGDYRTATVADPSADPDGDGLTNLQEYQQQTNPLKPQKAYEVGFVWDLSTVHKTGVSFNPDPDSTGRRPWRYMYKVGDNPVPLDGDYKPTPVAAGKIPYAGEMSHHMPSDDPRYKQAYGWIARHKNPQTQDWMIQLRPGANSAAILAWESPVSGTVSLDLITAVRPKAAAPYPATLTIQLGSKPQTLGNWQIRGEEATHLQASSIKVMPGDRIYIIASGQGQDVMLDRISIKLLELDQPVQR